jgi:hypothetical protein
MSVSPVELLFWAGGLLGHSALLIVLWARHRAGTFPFFTAFIAADVVRSITLFAVAHHGTTYDYLVTYVSLAIVDLVLQFCVTYELASHVFRPTGTWAPDVRTGFVILVIAGVVIAAALTCMPTPPEKTLWSSILARANLFSSALICELFVGMMAFSVNAGLPWKTHVARIAQGLGFYSLLGMVTEAGHNVIGMLRTSTMSHDLTLLRETTYLVCLSYWIVMLWRDAPAPRELPQEMLKQLISLQRYVEYDLRRLRLLKR